MTGESAFGAPYIRAVRAHLAVVVLVVVAAVGASVIYLSSSPRSYKATARLLVNPVNAQDAPQVGGPLIRDTGDAVRDVQTAAALVTSHAADALAARRIGGGWTPGAVKGAIAVNPEGQTSIVDITATAHGARLAARLANTYMGAVLAVRRAEFQRLSVPELQSAQAQLRALRDPNSATATSLQRQVSQLQAMSRGVDPNLSPAEAAVPADSASGPPGWLVIVLALLAGVVLASGTVLLLESVGPQRIGSEQELLAVYRLPILARLRWRSHLRSGPGPAAARADPLVRDAFQSVRLQLEIMGAHPRVVMITSPTRRDGKSSTAVSLGFELAANGATVVLVDADLRKPDLRRALGLDGAERTAQVPADPDTDIDLNGSLEPVPGEERLKLLALHEVVAPLDPPHVATSAISALVEQAALAADFVIVDTPPLGEVSDALPLLGCADRLLVVVRLGNTRKTSLEVTRDLLERSGARPAGYVVMGSAEALRTDPYPRTTRAGAEVGQRV